MLKTKHGEVATRVPLNRVPRTRNLAEMLSPARGRAFVLLQAASTCKDVTRV
jgi:hypothetical protein